MTEKLITFLEKKVAELKAGKMADEDIMELSEYFLYNNFQESCKEEISEKDMLRYMFAGYYVYQQLEQNEKNIPDIKDENVKGD